MANYDLENLLTDVGSIITSKLNTKITALNTEKGDSLLDAIDSNAVFEQTLDDKTVNYNPYLLYGIIDIEDIDQLQIGFSAEPVLIQVVIVMTKKADSNMTKRLLRYSRALKEIFEENYQMVNNGNQISIQRLMPITFQDSLDSNLYRAVGIDIKTTLG